MSVEIANYTEYEGRVPMDRILFVDRYIRPVTTNPLVLHAFLETDRGYFVPENLKCDTYMDTILPLKMSYSTMSQPSMMAEMMNVAGLDGRGKVLEVGTASGYGAALLSRCCDYVYTIEVDEELANGARKKLDDAGYANISVFHGDGVQGIPDAAPFDAIIVTAAASDIPKALVDQLAEGGRIVVPVDPDGEGRWNHKLVVGIKQNGALATYDAMERISFVPLISSEHGGWTIKEGLPEDQPIERETGTRAHALPEPTVRPIGNDARAELMESIANMVRMLSSVADAGPSDDEIKVFLGRFVVQPQESQEDEASSGTTINATPVILS